MSGTDNTQEDLIALGVDDEALDVRRQFQLHVGLHAARRDDGRLIGVEPQILKEEGAVLGADELGVGTVNLAVTVDVARNEESE